MNFRSDHLGEYSVDSAGHKIRLITFEDFDRMNQNCQAAAEHNKRAREVFKLKQNHRGRKAK